MNNAVTASKSSFVSMSPSAREMFSYLPAYYENSRVMQASLGSAGVELDKLTEALHETLDQFFVQTATWGLGYWENELGIYSDPTKPITQRRAVVESKLRGSGSFSGRLVQNVAEAYYVGGVEVSFQPAEWSFTIHFVDTIGVPPNLDDLKAMIEEIKPAHLMAEYSFSYFRIGDIHNVMTLAQLESQPLGNFDGRSDV
ncbi:hypothetical protein D3C77_238750 [compost metagenome]